MKYNRKIRKSVHKYLPVFLTIIFMMAALVCPGILMAYEEADPARLVTKTISVSDEAEAVSMSDDECGAAAVAGREGGEAAVAGRECGAAAVAGREGEAVSMDDGKTETMAVGDGNEDKVKKGEGASEEKSENESSNLENEELTAVDAEDGEAMAADDENEDKGKKGEGASEEESENESTDLKNEEVTAVDVEDGEAAAVGEGRGEAVAAGDGQNKKEGLNDAQGEAWQEEKSEIIVTDGNEDKGKKGEEADEGSGEVVALDDGNEDPGMIVTDGNEDKGKKGERASKEESENESSDLENEELAAVIYSEAKAYEPGKKSATVKGSKILNDQELKKGQFTFVLRDSNGQEIQRTTNNEDGSIVFEGVTFDSSMSGIYSYTVEELNDGQQAIEYDPQIYTVRIAVENGVVSEEYRSGKYFGISSGSTANVFYMSPIEGNKDFRVYCLDLSKKAPSGDGEYWVSETSPSEAILQASVTKTTGYDGTNAYYAYDGWVDDLKSSLKKVLYYFYLYPDAFDDNLQQQIIWMMTNGRNYTKTSNQQYILNLIESISEPTDMELVIFHPKDAAYQPMIALLPTGTIVSEEMGPIVFTNNYVGTPSGYKLPQTGSSGTEIIKMTGIGLLILAFVIMSAIVWTRSCKSERNDR